MARKWKSDYSPLDVELVEITVRTLGMVLMSVGLIGALIALTLGEVGSAALEPGAQRHLQAMFYGGAAMCALGAVLFTVRVLLARRRA